MNPHGRTAKGYGYDHQQRRKMWQAHINQGDVYCRRCGHLIAPGSLWDLGHHDADRSLPTHPEHRRCNRATNRRGRVTRGGRRRSSPGWQSEAWPS